MRGETHEPDANRTLAQLKATQFGVFSSEQAGGIGLSEDALYRGIRSGRLERVHPRVYRDPSVPGSWEQRLTAALLWAGDEAAVSHRSGAALWGFDGFDPGPVEITAPKARRYPTGVSLHRGKLLGGDVTTKRGFRTASATRTLIDLAGTVDEESLEIALDSALRQRLTSVRYLSDRLKDFKSGRKGTGTLAEMLRARAEIPRGLESPLETKFLRIVRKAQLPIPTAAYVVGPYRLDFAYVHAALAIELEGHRYHSGKISWLKDVARRNYMTDHGWTTLYFTWSDVTRTPTDVVAGIRQHLFPRLVR